MIRKGTEVEWRWGAHKAQGRIVERYTSPVEKDLKGTEVKRDASKDEPALLIRQSDGDTVLKSRSEIRPVAKSKAP